MPKLICTFPYLNFVAAHADNGGAISNDLVICSENLSQPKKLNHGKVENWHQWFWADWTTGNASWHQPSRS
jgi:hypothetical protein